MDPSEHPSTLIARSRKRVRIVYRTRLGVLFKGDCLDLLQAMPDGCVDMVFADPPFNLGKDYGPGISDQVRADEYVAWSRQWLGECVRVLAAGGALFVFNLPRWLVEYGAYLNSSGLWFRHWIAMRMPKAYPRGKRLSPAHYGCLYYTRGEPKTFNRVYIPVQTCRHCGGEVRDYGGHRKALNPKGINLMDVIDVPEEVWADASHPLAPGAGWTAMEDLRNDVPPVRHGRYKLRGANELAPIMLERLVALATDRGDLVFDPFGGSGTTYYAAEKLGRRWIGIELGDLKPAVRRLEDYRHGRHPEWESARGNGRRNGTSTGQLALLDEPPDASHR